MFALFHAICKRDLLGQGHDLIKKICNCDNNKTNLFISVR